MKNQLSRLFDKKNFYHLLNQTDFETVFLSRIPIVGSRLSISDSLVAVNKWLIDDKRLICPSLCIKVAHGHYSCMKHHGIRCNLLLLFTCVHLQNPYISPFNYSLLIFIKVHIFQEVLNVSCMYICLTHKIIRKNFRKLPHLSMFCTRRS